MKNRHLTIGEKLKRVWVWIKEIFNGEEIIAICLGGAMGKELFHFFGFGGLLCFVLGMIFIIIASSKN